MALIDARKALDMFAKTRVPVLGMIENMSTYICPNCGHEAHIFGHGGARAEADAARPAVPGRDPARPRDPRSPATAVRPVTAAAPDSPEAQAFRAVARRLIAGGIV